MVLRKLKIEKIQVVFDTQVIFIEFDDLEKWKLFAIIDYEWL